MAATAVHERPVELLQKLIQFDTTNPPGNEGECIRYIADLLTSAGCTPTIMAGDPSRPNLVARLAGDGRAAPLLLYGHVDVVPTANQAWRHPPFGGHVVDGEVWGRGALDMKGGVAMLVAAFLRAKAEQLPVAGDLILAVVSDEETGGDHGARWLVDNHADLFDGVRYALGEFGGFTLTVRGQRFYPVMVAEKVPCLLQLTVHGAGGHGSLPSRAGVAERLGDLLRQLTRRRLPPHVTPVARDLFEAMAARLPFPGGQTLRALLNPRVTDAVLRLLGEQGAVFDPLLHNSLNVTGVRAGEQLWGAPSQAVVGLAGSLLPGVDLAQFQGELRHLVGPDPAVEVIAYEATPNRLDMGLFGLLSEVLAEADPGATAVPLLSPGPTDGRHFARLGIQTYGFLPMRLPAELDFARLIHGVDERIPAEALTFGTDALYRVLERYG